MKKKLFAFALILLGVIGLTCTVQAAEGYYQEIRSFGDDIFVDLDGDGHREAVEVTTDYYSGSDGVTITEAALAIEGELVFETTVRGESWLNGYYIKMGNGEQLFLITMFGNNDYVYSSGLYALRNDFSIKRIANIKSIERGAWSHLGATPLKITVGNSSLKILCSTQLGGIGYINYTIPYIVKDGKATLSTKNFLLNHRRTPNKNKWTVNRSFVGYTRAYQGKKVFTAQIGQRAKISHVYFGSSYAYAKVQITQGSKVRNGWVKLPNSGNKPFFTETAYVG